MTNLRSWSWCVSLMAASASMACSKPSEPAAKSERGKVEEKASSVRTAELAAEPPPMAVASTDESRSLTFTNMCPFDVWIEFSGGNAANIPCSPSDKNAQANCPSNFICFQADENTNYCVPGTTSSSTFPVTNPADITLDAKQCKSGALVTTAGLQWGQCTCTDNKQCDSGQICNITGTVGVNQCFWSHEVPNAGQLCAAGSTSCSSSATLSVDIRRDNPIAIVDSGNVAINLGCDVNGNCLSDAGEATPVSVIEYTFANNQDFYDVSYINGFSVPIVMTPALSTELDYNKDDPYRCMAAGGDAGTLQQIAAFQSSNALPSNTELSPFACAYGYEQTFVDKLIGFNFVAAASGVAAAPEASACKTNADCTDGLTCGLTRDAVINGKELSCGNRLGYWSYTQLCGVSTDPENNGRSTFRDDALGVDCKDDTTRAYALCQNSSAVDDTGPGRSCFNQNSTVAGNTCCGFESWTFGGKAMPLAVGSSPVAGVDTKTWTSKIEPVVATMKTGCPLAYSYQFDDPYSTFTCATKAGEKNQADYEITMCPGGATAGINPPTVAPCVPVVPSGWDTSSNFTVAAPKDITLAIAGCDSNQKCTTVLTPVATSIYATGSETNYRVTATNANGNSMACTFAIAPNACVTRVDQTPQCNTWVVTTDGAWSGRSIAVPEF